MWGRSLRGLGICPIFESQLDTKQSKPRPSDPSCLSTLPLPSSSRAAVLRSHLGLGPQDQEKTLACQHCRHESKHSHYLMHKELWRIFYCLKIIIEASKTYNPTHVPIQVLYSLEESTGLFPPTLMPTPLARTLPWGGHLPALGPPCAKSRAGEGPWGEVGVAGSLHPPAPRPTIRSL